MIPRLQVKSYAREKGFLPGPDKSDWSEIGRIRITRTGSGIVRNYPGIPGVPAE
jgi:hypothetical protein